MALELQAAQDRYVGVNGLRLHYLDWGNADAPPMLLLHGYTGHAHTWDFFATALRGRYHILALDQRGHGDSAWAQDGYTHERFVDDVVGFVAALGLDRFILIGLSMGGLNAMGYMARDTSKVDRLVIVDIGPEIMAAGAGRIRAGQVAPPPEFASQEEAFQYLRSLGGFRNEKALRHRAHHAVRRQPDGRWRWKLDPALRQWTPAVPDLWPALARVPCPTLIVRGAESDILAPEVAERMAGTIPHATLVTVPDSGHPVPADQPAAFERAVRQFLGA
ncbi:MAG: alpha/beta hydrolase [Chloroflexi bacterium]|nr:alpha/beta hydrolase [Chloroflexota bacterium]